MSNELALALETIELLRATIRGFIAEARVCFARDDLAGFDRAFASAELSLDRLGELLDLRDRLELDEVRRLEDERQGRSS